jgi:hypothetical protein
MISFFVIFVIIGVFTVNTRYTRLNDDLDENSVIETFSSNENDQINKNAFLSRIKLNKDKEIAIYFNSIPFDLRISFGTHIFYMNNKALEDIRRDLLLRVKN